MPVNLINDEDLKKYIEENVYHDEEMKTFPKGVLTYKKEIEENKDAVARAIVMQWMKKHLYSYLTSKEDADFLLPVSENGNDLPEWAREKLNAGEKIYRFDAEKISDNVRNNIISVCDYLYDEASKYIETRKDVNKPRVDLGYLKTGDTFGDFEDVLELSKEWHEEIAREAENKILNEETLKKVLEGTEVVANFDGGMHIVRLTNKYALDYEGKRMGNCVGQGYYDEGVKKGTVEIYSLRDEKDKPHVTFEVEVDKETGKKTVKQCKGKQDLAPVLKYRTYAQQFAQEAGFDIDGDARYIGFIKEKSYWLKPDEITYFKKGGKYYVIKQDGIYSLSNGEKKGFIIKGDLDLSDLGLKKLPDLSDVIVEGEFNCSNNNLQSLKGAPQSVDGGFYCRGNPVALAVIYQDNKYYAIKQDGIYAFSEDGKLGEKVSGNKKDPFVVRGNLDLSELGLSELPDLSGVIVEGEFNCSNNNLQSLKGAPQNVGDYFDCRENQLTSLIGAPQCVDGNFYCGENQLTSLEGAPQSVCGDFYCGYNNLKSLKGAPQSVGGYFDCRENQLTSLIGAPQSVGGDFDCRENQLTSLEGAPQSVGGYFHCGYNNLKSLKGAPQSVGGKFNCCGNQLTSLEGAPEEVKGRFICDADFAQKHNITLGQSGSSAEAWVDDYSQIVELKKRSKVGAFKEKQKEDKKNILTGNAKQQEKGKKQEPGQSAIKYVQKVRNIRGRDRNIRWRGHE